MTVNWLGLDAVYTDPEREILATLPIREQAYVHILKAFTGGEVSEGLVPPFEIGSPDRGSSSRASGVVPTFIDPEDIPFGEDPKPPKKRPLYALSWTWRRHKVFKTKARASRSMKAWKKWYERQGWKVTSHADGYFAASSTGERHVIALHEYDAATHQRLK